MYDTNTSMITDRQQTVTDYSLTYLDLLVLAGNTRSYRVRNHSHRNPQTGNGFQRCCLPVHWQSNYCSK